MLNVCGVSDCLFVLGNLSIESGHVLVEIDYNEHVFICLHPGSNQSCVLGEMYASTHCGGG